MTDDDKDTFEDQRTTSTNDTILDQSESGNDTNDNYENIAADDVGHDITKDSMINDTSSKGNFQNNDFDDIIESKSTPADHFYIGNKNALDDDRVLFHDAKEDVWEIHDETFHELSDETER